jgi:hypothetical protein
MYQERKVSMPIEFPKPPQNYSSDKTIADAIRANVSEPLVPIVNDVIRAIPETTFFQTAPVYKNTYETLHITGVPKTAFRKAGTLRTFSTAMTELRLVKCEHIDASWILEKAIADMHDQGAGAACALAAKTHLQSALFTFAQQIWYGTKKDPNGFVGLNALLELAPEGKNINLKGTKDCTSVFAVRTGMDSIMVALGKEGAINETEIRLEMQTNVKAGTTSGEREGADFYVQGIDGYMGLQVTSFHAFSKLSNVSLTEAGKGLDTDVLRDLIYNTFPSGIKPDALFMTPRAWTNYCKTLTAFSPTGLPAAMLDNIDGVPIITTDAIMNNEETL